MARKKLPQLANEDEERAFWSEHDSTEYLDWSQARRASAPNLRPTLRTISLRVPAALLAELKTLANKRDVPYQSLLKSFLAERVAAERGSRTR